jgi:NADPH:quinone reductase-like Zn-dependent oxidoreductase
MKAMVWTEYGPPEVLQLQEVAAPTPGDNEVLVKIRATSVTAGDCELRGLKLPWWLSLLLRTYAGWRRPHRITILGQELAGEIAAVGSAVTRFQVGDQVFGTTGMRFGAYAEQQCLPEDAVLAHKPAQISYAAATCLPVGGRSG